MRWPLVGRAAFDVLERDNVWLREQLAAALDHNRRLERREAGLTELAPQPRKPPEPIPPEVRTMIEAFDSKATRQSLQRQVMQRRGEGYGWPEIAQELAKVMPEEEA